MFHAFDGLTLSVDEPTMESRVMGNATGGPPFPAITTTEVDRLVDDHGCVSVSMRTIPDPEQFAEILAQSLGDSFGAETSEDDNPFEGMTIEELVVAEVDGQTGRVLRVEQTETGSLSGDTGTRSTIVTDITHG